MVITCRMRQSLFLSILAAGDSCVDIEMLQTPAIQTSVTLAGLSTAFGKEAAVNGKLISSPLRPKAET